MDLTLIKKYITLPGISGNEGIVTQEYKNDIKKLGFEYIQDNLGSVFAIKKSKKENAKKIMLDSHCDEIGFIVTNVTKDGFIKFSDVGGFWPMTLLTNRVSVWSDNKQLKGSIVAPPPHLLKEEGWEKMPDIEKDMKIDIGLKNDKDAKKLNIKKGDPITFDSPVEEMQNNRIMGKSLDNRLGTTITLEVLKELKDIELPFDLYIGTSVQEEVGLRGARTISNMIKPDFALVVDVSPSSDTEENGVHGKLGEGSIIRIMDRAMISNPKIIDWQRKIAKENNIKIQNFVSPGGTNAGIIHLSNNGILTAQNGLVARSLHSQSTIADLGDYEETLKFIIAELKNLTDDVLQSFKFGNK